MPLHVRKKGLASRASWLNAKRNLSGFGFAGGKKSGRREDARGNGARIAGGNKRENREENNGSRGNAGQMRRRTEGRSDTDARKNASEDFDRKRKRDHESGYGGHSNAPSSKSMLNRKSPSSVTRGRVYDTKGDRPSSRSLDGDDDGSRSRRSSNSMDSSVSRGGRSNSMRSGMSRGGRSNSMGSGMSRGGRSNSMGSGISRGGRSDRMGSGISRGGRTNSMVSGISRGGRTNSMVSGISRGGRTNSMVSGRGRSVLGNNAETPNWKKFDKPTRVSRQKEVESNADLDEHGAESNISDDSNQITEDKPRPRRTRVLDKTGKKLKVTKNDSVSDCEEAIPPKRRKRMKLDPYDTSNKRIEDSPISQAGASATTMAFSPKKAVCKTEKIPENSSPEETEMSINAKFRSLQPSSSIISYVEDNLLGRRRLNEIKNAGYNVKLSAPLDNVPFSTRIERERIEESVFRNKLDFFAAAKVSSSLPPSTMPEIAFAGVSNVGKSSLLNALTRQWGIVRTSDKPGLTQTINFFRLASKLSLVDLPGYGFAYAKDEVKESWQELVKEYVSNRVGLERVCLLVHTKRGMKPLDYELVDIMERYKTPYQIVLTKTDLVFPIDVARRAMEIQQSLKKKKSVVNPVMMVSSKTGAGIRNLRGVLGKLARFIIP